MPAGRPKKFMKARPVSIYMDDKDLEYIDDHRGTIGRGEYLREVMYSIHSNSRIVSQLTEIAQLKREIQELKKQLLFEQSRNKKSEPVVDIPTICANPNFIKWYEEQNLTKAITKLGRGAKWDNLHNSNFRFLSDLGIENHKVLEKVCMHRYQNNGGAAIKTSEGA